MLALIWVKSTREGGICERKTESKRREDKYGESENEWTNLELLPISWKMHLPNKNTGSNVP